MISKYCIQMLEVYSVKPKEEVTNYFDSGFTVDVVYLDFQKAFEPENNSATLQ